MKVLLLHGKESQPGGTKARAIESAGHELINPDLRTGWPEAVQTAQDAVDEYRPDIVVGSSRGGALAMNIDAGGAPRILIAPAWKMFGGADTIPSNTIILHSEADDIVSFEDSIELAKRTGAKLVSVGSDHRMSDGEALSALVSYL
jgi:alpha-beta hydrolase superfamily lysophospholipase|tara:strand:- start:1270 stop:1707 length:438 start_codon:yes stop_codon:yes gene_type:complete